MSVPLVCAMSVAAGRQSEEMLTSADVVTLTEAGLPAAVVLTKIARRASSWIRASSSSWRYRRWGRTPG